MSSASSHELANENLASSRGERSTGIPGLSSLPLLGWRGNVLSILRDPTVHLLSLQQTYGDIVALGPEKDAPILLFAPEHNHLLLTNADLFYNFDVTDDSSPIRVPRNTAPARLLSGIAGMNGEKHREQRRLLMPGFHRKRVDMLAVTLAELTEQHIGGWSAGQTIDAAHEMVELSLSLAVSGLLGLNPGEEGQDVRHLLHLWGRQAMSAPVALFPVDLPGLPYWRFLRLSERLEAELKRILAEKRAHGSDSGDALSILLQAQNEDSSALSETDLLGHLTTFFTAGHETVASGLIWTLFLLAMHPRLTDELVEELDGELHGAAPGLENLKNLALLDNVINESLRMFPPAMWALRTAVAPFQLGPYDLPAGTHLVYSPAVTNRRPQVYETPDRFLPHRWETINPSPYEYLPFGAGPRRCLGATLAMMEMRIVLAMLLQRFRPVVPPGTRVDRAGTTLSKPKGSLPIVLYQREAAFPQPFVRGNVHKLVNLTN